MIFIDTGPFLARYLARDQHHAAALEGFRRIAEGPLPCATSALVLAELANLLARRAGGAFAADRLRSIHDSGVLEILRPARADEVAALDLLEKFADQRPSFTDCVSFVLMADRGIRDAFAFDRHFTTAGFRLWPE